MSSEPISPNEPQVPAAKQSAVLAASSSDAPFHNLPANVAVNPERLFAGGREVVDSYGHRSHTVRTTVGELNLQSGIVGVRDFSLDAWRITPLARRVQPGSYPVEVVEVSDRVVAIGISLSPDAAVAGWMAGATIRAKHIVPVDLGTASVFDMASYISMTNETKRRIFSEHRLAESGRPPACLVSMAHEDDGVVVTSGGSESGYAVYWGVDEMNQPISLVVDFLVLAEFQFERITEPWSLDQLGQPMLSPSLASRGLAVRVEHAGDDQITVTVDGKAELVKVRMLGSEGSEPLLSNGVVRSGKQRRHTFTGHLLDLSEIEFSIPAGYSN